MIKKFQRYRVGEWHGDKEITVEGRRTSMEPQFRVKDLYVAPFREKRIYDPDGNITWQKLDPTPKRTGIRVLDEYLTMLAAGKRSIWNFCRTRGIREAELSALILLTTDVPTATDLRMTWSALMVDDLLRYTKLSVNEVAKQAGFGSASALNTAARTYFGMSPTKRRRLIQKEGDAGRYRL